MIPEPGYGRTRNSLRNSATALILQVVAMLIGFFSRRIFIRILGVEVMGLNTTASSILDFLNLAELGIETAVAVTLYKPLFSRDEQSIREIVALQGRLYRCPRRKPGRVLLHPAHLREVSPSPLVFVRDVRGPAVLFLALVFLQL